MRGGKGPHLPLLERLHGYNFGVAMGCERASGYKSGYESVTGCKWFVERTL